MKTLRTERHATPTISPCARATTILYSSPVTAHPRAKFGSRAKAMRTRPGMACRCSSARMAASSDGAANSTVTSMIGLNERRVVRLVAQREILPLHHLGAKQQIDGKEMTPHEPVPAVHFEIETASEDRRDAVEALPRLDAALLHLIGGHAARREGHHPVAIFRSEPPAVVQQTPFALQPVVQRRSGKRSEVIESHDVELVALGEGQRLLQRVAVVFVVAEDEGHVEADLVALQIRERLLVAARHHVEGLAHLAQILGIEGLESDQQALTSAGFDELQEFFVVRGIDAGLSHPADLQRDERAEKLFGLIHVGGDVVVDEKDQRLFDAADLLDDLFGRPARLRVREVGLNRAELAAEMAAASRFYQSDRQVALSFE